MTTSSITLATGAIADDLLAYEIGFSINENVFAHDALTFAYVPGSGGLSETAKVTATFGFQLTSHLAMTEHVQATSSFATSYNQTKTFSATATGTFGVAMGYALKANATATGTFGTKMTSHPNMTANAVAHDAVSITPSKSLTSNAVAHDSLSYAYTAGAAINENAVAHSSLVNTHQLQAALAETTYVHDMPQPNFVWSAAISEIAYAGLLPEPDGSSTTWAINTRTNAVTQYSDNFNFNSFAAFGRKYVAADENGLYELNGPRDLTENVVAEMEGGFFQPADGKLAGFKGCYMAVNGQGNWQLTLTAGDGRVYVYQRYSNPSLMTTKFEIGKGLRSRYFAWKLVSIDGQDFDFDKIEFVPMISQRRIG